MRPDAHRGGAVILAAGFARRFGADKRRHVLPDGRPMLLATLTLYRSVFPHVVVVLRLQDTDLARELGTAIPDLSIVESPDAALGMGHSLAAGIRSLAGWSYAFVGLGDMPFVAVSTLERLRERIVAAHPPAILQPTFDGAPGHPVGFHAAFFDELAQSRGDEGARTVLRRHPDALLRVETNDPGVVRDLDRPD